jgi:hypothetical protein
MKKLLTLFCACVSIMHIAQGQTPSGWSNFTDSETGFEFSLPSNAAQFDSLLTKVYTADMGTSEAVQVHIFKEASFTGSGELFDEALVLEASDTLRAIARLMLLASNSEVSQVEEIFTDGIRGLEIGLVYQSLQSNTQYHSFVRYYLYRRHFIAFTWTGPSSSIGRTSSHLGEFFDSIDH